MGQAGRGRAQGGERPMGHRRLWRETVQGKSSGKWRAVKARRQLQTATQPRVMSNPPHSSPNPTLEGPGGNR